MYIINYFSNKKYKILNRTVEIDAASGAGIAKWTASKEILGYYEPEESLVGTEAGNEYGVSAVFYSSEKLTPADRIEIDGNIFEIREVEFWQLRGFSYYKGYLVKTDEDL